MRKLAVICLSMVCFCFGAIAHADENGGSLRALFEKGKTPADDQLKLHQKWSCTDGVFYIFEASSGWVVARTNKGHANFLRISNSLEQVARKKGDARQLVRVSEPTGDLIVEQVAPDGPLYQTYPASAADSALKSMGYAECPASLASPISKEALAVMRAYLPLNGPTVAISEREAAAYRQQLLRGEASVSFEQAFTAGLNSWLEDDRDSESLTNVIRAQEPETLEVDVKKTLGAHRDNRNRILDHPNTVFTLLPAEEAAPYGEQPSANWIFALSVGELSDHQFFAVVDPQNPQKVYNYGFN